MEWPNGAQCAVAITIDVDGPTNWINLDQRVWQWPKTLSLGNYGPLRGLPRILDLLEEHAVPATFFFPGWVAEQWPERFREIDRCGHEIGNHGYLHESFVGKPAQAQLDIIEKCQTTFRRLIGKEAFGFRAPSDITLETPKLLSEMGFSYSSSMHGDDRPYLWTIDGRQSDLVEIPVHWELDDFPQFAFNLTPALPIGQDRIASHASVLSTWIQEFESYYRFGLCYVIRLDPQFIGKPGRMIILDQLIRHIKTFPHTWFGRGSEIAQYARDAAHRR